VDATNKCAWAENAGWVNTSPTNSGVTVHFDGTGGHLTGYAWGENIGWIKLGVTSGGPYKGTSSTNWGVNLDAAGTLSGYAWGANVGWIKFDPLHSTVTIDMATGRFNGSAWGENVGWVRFQSAAPDGTVRTTAFDTQLHGTPNWWLALDGIDENYDTGHGIPAWQAYVADTDPTNPSAYFHIVAISNQTSTVCFLSSSRRVYTLERCADLQSQNWTNVLTQTDIPGTGGLDSLRDPSVAVQGFYRVKVALPP
jgi:hypothetical protein